MSKLANNPMFEKTDLTLLIRSNHGFKEVYVYEMDGELFFKNGAYYLRIKRDGMTSNSKLSWVRFSNKMVPTYSAIGWAKAGGRWVKEPKKTVIK